MQPTSTRARPLSNDTIVRTKPKAFRNPLPAFFQTRRRASWLALLATTIVAPLSAQAALPQAIQAALSRADLSEQDISIVITPVGDKNASHLPAPIQVVDSHGSQSVEPTTGHHSAFDQHSALVTIEKRTIKKHEQKIHAYTDDPYTYQSLESVPTLIPDHYYSAPSSSTSPQETGDENNNANNNGNGNGSENNQTHSASSSLKISFSPLLSHQPDIARTPASTMKLVPSFIALDMLGADFVWHTRVYHTGVIVNDRLYGDLVIQGSGDPKMTHERLEQLLYQVQASGIRHIDGDIVVDSAIFHNVTKNPAAFDNDPLRPYNASPDGFLVNFSTLGIKTYPMSNGQASLTYEPTLANYQLPNLINTRSAACGQARYSLAPKWQTNRLVLNASLPDRCQEHVFYIAYPDAKAFAARVIAGKWQALGNTLSGRVITQETPYNAAEKTKHAHGLAALPMSPLPIVSYPSLNLRQQIYDINHFSNNVMAEQVALSIGAYHQDNNASLNTKKGGSPKNTINQKVNNEKVDNQLFSHKTSSLYQFGQPTTTDYPATLQTINQWWQNHLKTPPPHLTNGSGLCRDCTITAANLSELLTYAYNRPNFDAYVNALGVAGVSGTIAAHSDRLPESSAIGRAWIKTGTLNNVTSMAGYVKGLSGQDYVVVGLINSDQALNPYAARPVLDAMLDWTAQH
ncbi:D-alanyl-D-alanine carboxypeptidase [Psychrobacter sp. B38]|uniref:D-alanyl-D-alanine carboxypeptidase/D-alanyl-D-alanine-endopeptidase n=1 Tax=Psychrobacter sp. B38 TaxID=3143538 RepID=UPI00320DD775